MKQKTSELKRTDNFACQTAESPYHTCLSSGTNPLSLSGLPVMVPNATSAVQPVQAPPSPNTALTPATPQPALDRFLQIKIDSLKEKQRADSFFNSLSPEQTLKFIEWIRADEKNAYELWTRVTKPAPDGLGLQVSLKTITRLRDAWRAEDLVTMTSSSLDVLIDVEERTGLDHAPRFQSVMNQMLCETAFDLMRTQPASTLLPELLTNIKKLTELELKRQKLQLQREKLLLQHKSASAPSNHAEQPSVQHHRVDLNIVPPNQMPPRETVVIESEPQGPSAPAPQPKVQPKLKPPIL